ncbi:hypothetical protein HZS55_04515 [Halosimplex rubrum]|uniref:Serine-tRNA synthetase type1 N-terminal domain-containing protein n=1 Tax=Halosimplex rubrum TaxID=869889 RepID=A0A7D5TKG5_9EURY|nr:hypothetical protein [Halosimplex rubrum]QLH76612.1 hypothetical protein HZS55_04515 [Halosimplex rubrum]
MSETRTLERHEGAVRVAGADDLSSEAVAELLALQSRKERLEARIDDIRRERSLQADCIGELKFQGEDAAVRTHEERMATLGEELTAVRERLETVETEIDRTLAAVVDARERAGRRRGVEGSDDSADATDDNADGAVDAPDEDSGGPSAR